MFFASALQTVFGKFGCRNFICCRSTLDKVTDFESENIDLRCSVAQYGILFHERTANI